MGKITKDNYNELKSKELDNNYAKVWHVNEIREELLNNTSTGGVTTVNGLTGNIVFEAASKSFTFTPTQDDAENGTIVVDPGIEYHESYFELVDDGTTADVNYHYTNTSNFIDSGDTLDYTVTWNSSTAAYDFVPNTYFTGFTMNIQLTIGSSTITYIPKVSTIDNATGRFSIQTIRASTLTALRVEGKVLIALKIFNPSPAEP